MRAVALGKSIRGSHAGRALSREVQDAPTLAPHPATKECTPLYKVNALVFKVLNRQVEVAAMVTDTHGIQMREELCRASVLHFLTGSTNFKNQMEEANHLKHLETF